jgi:hypothetical protein
MKASIVSLEPGMFAILERSKHCSVIVKGPVGFLSTHSNSIDDGNKSKKKGTTEKSGGKGRKKERIYALICVLTGPDCVT